MSADCRPTAGSERLQDDIGVAYVGTLGRSRPAYEDSGGLRRAGRRGYGPAPETGLEPVSSV
jgi:hypothetical protein